MATTALGLLLLSMLGVVMWGLCEGLVWLVRSLRAKWGGNMETRDLDVMAKALLTQPEVAAAFDHLLAKVGRAEANVERLTYERDKCQQQAVDAEARSREMVEILRRRDAVIAAVRAFARRHESTGDAKADLDRIVALGQAVDDALAALDAPEPTP